MNKRWLWLHSTLFITLTLLAIILASIKPATATSKQSTSPLITDDLATALAVSDTVRAIIYLEERADLSDRSLPSERGERTTAVVERLQATAATSQARLLSELTLLDGVQAVRSFWVVNAIGLEISAETIPTLQTLSSIQQIDLDHVTKLPVDPLLPRNNVPQLTLGDNRDGQGTVVQISDDDEGYLTAWGIDQIGASKVWHGLGLDGDGIIVANMDTGVDFAHPELSHSYYGNRNGTISHDESWFDATEEASPVPVDPIWHGTHTMGSMVGQTVGVAPGARWMAVRIFDSNGSAPNSNVLAALQWLLAPNGDPQHAPHIVNNSWNGAADNLAFLLGMNALHAAGIMTTNSAGNDGRGFNQIGAPASYPDLLTVGASELPDRTAWFSSRGPSLLTDQQKPQLVAPGVLVRSAVPWGYASASGTSMAAPHAAGVLALLLAADPTLDYSAATAILTQTVQPIDATHPNIDSGWGRLDAYAAVATVADTPTLNLALRANGAAVPDAAVTITTASGEALHFTSDASGLVAAPLKAGVYVISAEKYGHTPTTQTITLSPTTPQTSLTLTRLPHVRVSGDIEDDSGNFGGPPPHTSGNPLTATVTIIETGQTVQADENGRFKFDLPSGSYSFYYSHLGYRSHFKHAVAIEANIEDAQETNVFVLTTVQLAPAPKILLIDATGWQYDPYADYYRQALQDAEYSYDEWVIRDPYWGEPTGADLRPYDVVIWADSGFSPDSIDGDRPLVDYLNHDGNLLVAGQFVGAWDGLIYSSQWWYERLYGRYDDRVAPDVTLRGSAEIPLFADVEIEFNGVDSAENQDSIEQVSPNQFSLTQPLLTHPDGSAAALVADTCNDYRLIYFGFGLEGVTGAATRSDLLDRSLRYFERPPNPRGLRISTPPLDDFILSGQTKRYTVTVRNLSETTTDTIRFTSSASWATVPTTTTVSVPPCKTAHSVFEVTAPPNLPKGTTHTGQLKVTSALGAPEQAIPLVHQTPQDILFVDDDRFYDYEDAYRDVLDERNVPYDYWEVAGSNGLLLNTRQSVPPELLNAYDIVLWSTGYDWFQPVTPQEADNLYDYMQQGGRLLLSSHDYLSHNFFHPLTYEFLGVSAYTDGVKIDSLFAETLPASTLNYSDYQQFSDGIVPADRAEPIAWSDSGMPAALRMAGADWRSSFWGVPIEIMEGNSAESAFNDSLFWLSDLAETTLEVDQAHGTIGAVRSFTLTVRNLASAANNVVTVENVLGTGWELEPRSTVGASFDGEALNWQGVLPSGGEHTITYRAVPTGKTGRLATSRATLHYLRHNLRVDITTGVALDLPDLTTSTLHASPAPTLGEPISYILNIANRASGGPVTATLYLPLHAQLVTETVTASVGRTTIVSSTILWSGELSYRDEVTIQAVVTTVLSAETQHAGALAVIENGSGYPILRHTLQSVYSPYRFVFPIVAK